MERLLVKTHEYKDKNLYLVYTSHSLNIHYFVHNYPWLTPTLNHHHDTDYT